MKDETILYGLIRFAPQDSAEVLLLYLGAPLFFLNRVR